MTSQNDSGCDESYDAYKRVSAEFRDRPKEVDVVVNIAPDSKADADESGQLNAEQINEIIKEYVSFETLPAAKQANVVKSEQENRSDMAQLLAELDQEYQVLQETSINWAIRYTHRMVTIEHLIKKLQDIRNSLRRIEKTRARLHADLAGCGIGV